MNEREREKENKSADKQAYCIEKSCSFFDRNNNSTQKKLIKFCEKKRRIDFSWW